MLEKVISGGQTGADQGGLLAASMLGIETGGWIPKGFLTEKGSCPELKTKYGLQEHASSDFRDRTFDNVRDSDGTIRFAVDFATAGEKCTFKAIQEHCKPSFDVYVKKPAEVEAAVKWLHDNKVKTLNVAGNRESTYPGMEEFVCKYLLEVFKRILYVSFIDTLYMTFSLNISDQKPLEILDLKEVGTGREILMKSFPKIQALVLNKKMLIRDKKGERQVSIMTFRGSYPDLKAMIHKQLDAVLDEVFYQSTMNFFHNL